MNSTSQILNQILQAPRGYHQQESNYTAGDETGNQWLNGAAISFVNLILLLFFRYAPALLCI